MSVDLTDPALALSWIPSTYHVLRLSPTMPLPSEFLLHLGTIPSPSAPFRSITQTPKETSLIISTDVFTSLPIYDSAKFEGPWRIFRVRGPMELHMTGIMARITAPLKEKGVAIFASSTYDTDYVLVHKVDEEKCQKALEEDGWVWE